MSATDRDPNDLTRKWIDHIDDRNSLEVDRWRNAVWVTAWSDDGGLVFDLTPVTAREIAAHLIACADAAEGAPDE